MVDFALVEESFLADFTPGICNFCLKEVSVPYYLYYASFKAKFYLHKACGDLPEEIEHELHPGHSLRCHLYLPKEIDQHDLHPELTILSLFSLSQYLPKKIDHREPCLQVESTIRSHIRQVGEIAQLCNCCNGYALVHYSCTGCKDFDLCIICALKLFPVTHQCHPHPLIPIHQHEEFHCAVCATVHQHGISYRCDTCQFRVKQNCVSQRIVKLPTHRHKLKFMYSLPAKNHLQKPICCQICRKRLKDYAYRCTECRHYYIHIYNCRPTEHFSHDHPLVLVQEEKGANAESPPGNCYGCGIKISAPYYICFDETYIGVDEVCKSFFLHKFCAELPDEVEHHLHPKHTLTLSKMVNSDEFMCNACHLPWKGFSYSCAHASSCFTIDILCSMKVSHLYKFHKHPLIATHTTPSSVCRACNTNDDGMSFQCNTCRFWVHQRCASAPAIVTLHDFHPHKLKLIYSLQCSSMENRKHFYCHVCRKVIQPHNWAYKCAVCGFFTHVHDCLDPNREIAEFDYEKALAIAVHLPVANEFVSLATLFFMKEHEELDGEEDANDRENWDFSFLDPYRTCRICAKHLARPCKKCALCKYFLPKFPAQLLHASLIEGYSSVLNNTEENGCNGFGMSFSEDIPTIKVSSSILPRYVNHVGHNHVLSTSYIVEQTWCNACQKFFCGYGFRCNICSFTIDTYCALLPQSVSHSYDKVHPFKLTFYSIEGVEEYVCEICEKDIITMWFYHCVECDLSIHPRCIWKIHIKFGPFVDISYLGNDVTLVPTISLPSNCHNCHKKWNYGCGYSLFLSEASSEYAMHLECLSQINKTEMKRWPREEEELRRMVEAISDRKSAG